MIVNNVGYNHCHDADFFINRPNGSGDYLLLLLKTDTLFTIDGRDIIAQKNLVFLYPKGRPQYYRCIPQNTFENDWIHFDFLSKKKESDFLSKNIPLEEPIYMNLNFLSFCIKSIAYEFYSNHPYKNQSILSYMFLVFIKIAEHIEQTCLPQPILALRKLQNSAVIVLMYTLPVNLRSKQEQHLQSTEIFHKLLINASLNLTKSK